MPEPITVEDVFGITVKAGDRIAYPVRRNSTMSQHTARVEYINREGGILTIHARNPDGRIVKITGIDRVVKGPAESPR